MNLTTITCLLATCVPALAQDSKPVGVLPARPDAKFIAGPAEKSGPPSFTARPCATSPSSARGERSDAALARAARQALDARVRHDVDESGHLWVRGADYKARFGPDGETFFPRLSPRATGDHGVSFALANVSSGGEPIAFEAGVRPTAVLDRVVYDRGSVVEAYHLSVGGIEQTFTFANAPRDADLTVTLDVASELAARDDGQGFRFENEFGFVRYGRAFALDAAGRKRAIESRLSEGRIDLVVPRDFLADALFPVTIDPVQGTTAIDTDADVDFGSDVATDATAGTFVVVYETAFSATDHDVHWVEMVDGVVTNTGDVEFTTQDWRHPRIANNNQANQFLIVAEVGAAPNRTIRGRTMDAVAHVASNVSFLVSGAEGGDKHAPDVGGDPSPVAPTYYCVVWQRDLGASDSDVHARVVQTDGTLLGLTTIPLENAGNRIDRAPSISKSNGLEPFSTQDWNIAWEYAFSATDTDVYGARIHWDGNVTTPAFAIGATTLDESEPCPSAPTDATPYGRPWAVAYSIEVAPGNHDILVSTLQDATLIDWLDLTYVAGGPDGDDGSPAVDVDGRQFMLAYERSQGAFPSSSTDIVAATVYVQNGVMGVSEANRIVTSAGQYNRNPSVATTHGGAWPNPYRMCVSYDRSGLVLSGDVYATFYDSPISAGIESLCAGTAAACPCGNGGDGQSGCANSVNPDGARLEANGAAYVSADYFSLTGSGMPSTSTCLYFQGSGVANSGAGTAFGDGLRCASGVVIRLGAQTNVGGSSHYPAAGDPPIHERGLVGAAGGSRTYQCWYRNSAAFCTTSTFNLTQGLRVVWLP